MSQAINTSAAIYDPGVGSKHAVGEAQSSAITNTRRGRTRDRRPSEEEPLSILTTFQEADRSEVVQSPDRVIRRNDALQRRLRYCSRRELSVDGSTNHKLYTNAAIVSARGIVELARVKIDGGSLHNLLPRSIASRLGLPLHFGSSIRVNQLSDLGNYRYYIPGSHGNLNELPVPRPIIDAEAEMEFAMEEEIAIGAAIIREGTLMAEEAPTALRGDEGHGDEEYELGELANEVVWVSV
ncbi:uncharacterized protein LY89DRAFT_678297 [Mollisia scopiformis]|uniref:Uncharacterized protein n=1 Tax=Mollisia scopiformis TaxID=149040 RepID=A0A132B3Q5_MOLSC|nr:uncharacterized protein LY89DRAFT_678297 [Mollisia scopiformis]KUJ07016.1 hypothetical protein LY89DRAFT_678297 [Mollisia scopiformis]